MLRRIIAGTAVAGALTMGVAGVAGAATPNSGSSTNGTPSAKVCARAAKIEARVQKLEAKLNAFVPKAEAREAKAKANGHTKLATAIANRITKVQNREAKINTRLSKLEAKCGTASSGATGFDELSAGGARTAPHPTSRAASREGRSAIRPPIGRAPLASRVGQSRWWPFARPRRRSGPPPRPPRSRRKP